MLFVPSTNRLDTLFSPFIRLKPNFFDLRPMRTIAHHKAAPMHSPLKSSFIFIALLSLAFGACTKPVKIMDDFQKTLILVHVSPTFYQYFIDVELYDLNDPDAAFSAPTEISVSGLAAAGISNIDGSTNFKINLGLPYLMAADEFEPTEDNPPEFRITSKAADYQEHGLNIIVGPDSYYQWHALAPLNLLNLPPSVSFAQQKKGHRPNYQHPPNPLDSIHGNRQTY